MILTNERVDAARALRIGLVEQVVPRGQARAAALNMAARGAALRPAAVEYRKTLIPQARLCGPRGAARSLEREKFIDLFEGADQREGVNAFLEKRTPAWRGD